MPSAGYDRWGRWVHKYEAPRIVKPPRGTHNVDVIDRGGDQRWQPVCSCDWTGIREWNQESALAAAKRHKDGTP
jgi:hypothetical protein